MDQEKTMTPKATPKIEKKSKRSKVLYTRIKGENKDFIQRKAKEKGMSESEFVDSLIELYRKESKSV